MIQPHTANVSRKSVGELWTAERINIGSNDVAIGGRSAIIKLWRITDCFGQLFDTERKLMFDMQ